MRPTTNDVIGGKYRIQRLIGDGGMGAVYEARHEVLGSPVALKFLHPELTRRPGLAQRFLQEARVSASIQSPHVTRVTDVDQTGDGAPYLVMELLNGESLQQLLDRELSLDCDRALDFSLQILAGLEAAHALGVVHRDLKPDNVFITPSTGGPVLKLLDFGIAKLRDANEYKKGLTRPGAVMGTPEYMAPEQLYTADQVDHRADIYSIGAMLYEMLSGKRPADGDDAPSIIAQVAQKKIMRLSEHVPTLPDGLVEAVHRALEPERENRFGSATELRLALAPFAGNLSHAGRLAATPAPISASTDAPPPTGQPSTQDLPAPAGVPPTLPPDDEAPAAAAPGVVPTDPNVAAVESGNKGSTQDAPRGVIGQMAATGATPAYAPAAAAGYAPQPGGSGPYGPPPGAYAGYAPAAPRSGGGRALGALIALLLGLLVTGGVIAAIVLLKQEDASELPPLPTFDVAPPATVAPQGGGTAPVPPGAVPPGTPTPATPHPNPGGGPVGPAPKPDAGAADAGQPSQADAGGPHWQFPGLPPIPAQPSIPSGWPSIPGITPPPASSR